MNQRSFILHFGDSSSVASLQAGLPFQQALPTKWQTQSLLLLDQRNPCATLVIFLLTLHPSTAHASLQTDILWKCGGRIFLIHKNYNMKIFKVSGIFSDGCISPTRDDALLHSFGDDADGS